MVKSLQKSYQQKLKPRNRVDVLNYPLTGNKVGDQVLLTLPPCPLNKHIICNCTSNEYIQEWCSACFEWSQLTWQGTLDCGARVVGI